MSIRRQIRVLIIALTLLCQLSGIRQGVAQDTYYQSQSLFIYKFTKYIIWPKNMTSGNFVICVYGNSPVVKELETMAALKKAGKGQNIVIVQVQTLDNLPKAHILYIPSSKSRELADIMEKTKKAGVLIIAEREGLAKKGAVINFMTTEDELLKFEINVARLKEQLLDIMPELLKLGYKVG
ncbi:MAG: YfiR family protein [Bacteroidetes bacterium]|nr:YfiR family protein [Bacteroidota bacterium]